jgi:hypothetical protein
MLLGQIHSCIPRNSSSFEIAVHNEVTSMRRGHPEQDISGPLRVSKNAHVTGRTKVVIFIRTFLQCESKNQVAGLQRLGYYRM